MSQKLAAQARKLNCVLPGSGKDSKHKYGAINKQKIK